MVTRSETRSVPVPGGTISYTLTWKNVKNKNLRITPDGAVAVSIPNRCTRREADQLVKEKADWIFQVQQRMAQRHPASELPPPPSRADCIRILSSALNRVYPRVKPLGVSMPALKIRAMSSQWGNCHWRDGYVTLNTALAQLPEDLQDYVALHELVHFLAHDHGPGFYSFMTRLMPDWQNRRHELRRYEGNLRRQDGSS